MNKAPPRVRNDAAWYTPANLPPELLFYDTPLDDLGVGCAGKVGLLELGFAPVAGTTRVVRQFQQLPLYVFNTLHIDPEWPDMAFVYALQSGEGLVQGDRYRLDLHCSPGSAVHFTTQSATKIYRMENNFASQIVNLSVGAGGFVEYLPDPVIPFRGSRFFQRMHLTVDPDATVICGEILLPGRVARGEMHAYDFYCTDTEVYAPDGSLLFADRLKLAPHAIPPSSPELLGGYDVLATLYVITGSVAAADLVDRLYGKLTQPSEALGGVSELPNHCGAVVRALGRTSAEVAATIRGAWNEARMAVSGRPAPDLRKP